MTRKTITIGWTKSDRAKDYVSFTDGFRFDADQYTVSIVVDTADLETFQIAEAVYVATNSPGYEYMTPVERAIADAIRETGYRGEQAHYSLSVGDTVRVNGRLIECAHAGWGDITALQGA